MALKKFHLYSSLWQSCDELCGSMDASQYKDYIRLVFSNANLSPAIKKCRKCSSSAVNRLWHDPPPHLH